MPRNGTSDILVKRVAEETECSEELVKFIIESANKNIREMVLMDQPVTLYDLGTFLPYTAKATQLRHRDTKELYSIPERRLIRFRVNEKLRKSLTKGGGDEADT